MWVETAEQGKWRKNNWYKGMKLLNYLLMNKVRNLYTDFKTAQFKGPVYSLSEPVLPPEELVITTQVTSFFTKPLPKTWKSASPPSPLPSST